MMSHTHLQQRSAQYRQTHISTRFCGTIQFLWGHGIAWLAKEFNFLFSDFGVLSFSKQILRFLLSFLGMAQQVRDGVNIITFCFCFLFLQTFEIVCTIWAHHVGFACWAHGQAGIPFYSPPPWGDTASFLRWEHMYVKRKWLCVESYSVPFYLLQSCLVLGLAGESEGCSDSRRLL